MFNSLSLMINYAMDSFCLIVDRQTSIERSFLLYLNSNIDINSQVDSLVFMSLSRFCKKRDDKRAVKLEDNLSVVTVASTKLLQRNINELFFHSALLRNVIFSV